jgi:3-(3-hydroxy-phenyl)propionate hydroxylase
MPPQRPILIAGGGPVGVIAALALARQGFAVEVFEADQCRLQA